jgi:hypothetical protein
MPYSGTSGRNLVAWSNLATRARQAVQWAAGAFGDPMGKPGSRRAIRIAVRRRGLLTRLRTDMPAS